VYNSHPYIPYKPSIRRSPGGTSETFMINKAVGVAEGSIHGAFTEGYFNSHDCVVLEFKIGNDEFRWVFDEYISNGVRDLVLSGIKHDPEYRKQFRQPAVPAKQVEQEQLTALLSAAFGEHEIVSLGDSEPTPHSWENITKVLMHEKLPADFATFARKCKFLNLSKVKGKDCIAVIAPVGSACQGNLMLLKILTDYTANQLGDQSDYALSGPRSRTMPSKPTITKAEPTPEQIAARPKVADVTEQLKTPQYPEQLKKTLMFLKAGRDEFSKMKEPELKSKIDPEDRKKIEKALKRPADVLKGIRWQLRGLSTEDAIYKVQLDIEGAKRFIERAEANKEFD
jgi:hypothetical protein